MKFNKSWAFIVIINLLFINNYAMASLDFEKLDNEFQDVLQQTKSCISSLSIDSNQQLKLLKYKVNLQIQYVDTLQTLYETLLNKPYPHFDIKKSLIQQRNAFKEMRKKAKDIQ